MRKKNLKLLMFLSVSFIFFTMFLLAITFPKFLLFDRWLMSKGIYLIASNVHEGLTYLSLKEASFYTKNSKLVRFDKLDLSVGIPYILLNGTCADGYLNVKMYLSGGIDIKAKNFKCFENFGIKSINLRINDGIEGTAELLDLKVRDTKVDNLSVSFKGKTFDGQGLISGQRLTGSGTLILNREDILKSRLNGTIAGSGIRFVIYGSLDNPALEIKK